jgi:hypothetical protein
MVLGGVGFVEVMEITSGVQVLDSELEGGGT